MVITSELPPIVSPEHFFNADKILYIYFDELFPRNDLQIKILQQDKDTVQYGNRYFRPLFIKGSPQNLYLKLKAVTDLFDGDLEKAISEGKLFDFSAQYKKEDIDYKIEKDWYIEKYISKIPKRMDVIKLRVENGKVVE
jgi:hypothetical protein